MLESRASGRLLTESLRRALPRNTITDPSPLGKLLRQPPKKPSPTGFSPCLQAPKRLLCLRFKRVLGDKHVTLSNPKTVDYPPTTRYHLAAMKTLIPLTALAALVASSTSFAQTPAFSKPSGYTTKSLLQGFNLVGLNLQTPTVASGVFENAVGTALTDDELSLSPVAGKTYILEITASATPALVGTIQDIASTSISGTTITSNDDLAALGLAAGDSYALRVAPTLEDVFGVVSVTNGGTLQAALSSNSADVVWVPTGTGNYTKYYLHNTGAFRNVATNVASPNIPLIYADGLLIQKRNTVAASLTVTGEVKLVGTNSVIVQGFNPVSVVSPAGLNLWNSGLADDLQAALSSNSADIIWVQQANLAYEKYYRHSSGNWRNVVTNVNLTQSEAEAVSLSNSILIQRRAVSPINLDLNVPESYSNL
jgi:hypothetical protein